MSGKFITLEGIDGAGKSTHLAWFAAALARRGIAHRVTREPGGTPLGERVRAELLDPDHSVDGETEALLMFAARNEHLARVIRPALAAGEWVLCDRFSDATFAYQGGGRGVAMAKLEALEAWVQGNLQPDATFYFDLPAAMARQRLQGVRTPDKFELEQVEFFERVRQAYLERARRFTQRIRVIDASRPIEEVQERLGSALTDLLAR